MKNTQKSALYMARKSIAQRWDVDPTTVTRMMANYGFEGLKSGNAKSASVRFLKADVAKVEALRRPRAVASLPARSS